MRRAWLAGFLMVQLTGCSLVLDFSKGAVPIDAEIDAVYTAEECAYLEPNDSLETAAPFTPADVGPAAICAGDFDDHDFYKFTVPANTASVSVSIAFTNRAKGDLELKLTDATGAMKGQSRGFGDEEKIVCPATSPPCGVLMPGDYVFEVFPALTGSVNNYSISLAITPM